MARDTKSLTTANKTAPEFRKSSILSGIMVGLLVQNGSRPRPFDQLAPGFPSAKPRARGWKRFLLSHLRVLLTPIMHRIELRVRSAVEKTGLAANVFEVRNSVTTLQNEMSHLKKTSDDILALLQAREPMRSETPPMQMVIAPLGEDLLGIQTSFGYLTIHRDNPALPHLLAGNFTPHMVVNLLTEQLSPGACLLSIGVSTGIEELAAAAKVGKAGSVIVCGIDEDSAAALRMAAFINQVAQIIKIRDDHAQREKPQSATGTRADGLAQSLALSATETVATVLRLGIKVDVAKIDVAGGEIEALRAIRPLLGDNPQMSIFLKLHSGGWDPSGGVATKWLAAVSELDLVAHMIEADLSGRPATRTTDLDHPLPMNLLLLHKGSRRLALTQPFLQP